MPFLKLNNVTKTYDGIKQIIQPLNVEIKKGEFIVIVGPSGCGKSTLLRMVAGLEKTTSGQIWIDQRDVTEEEPKDRQIAMVFQNYALYPHMSVFDNIAYGLKIRGESKDAIRQKVDEVAKILSLDALLDRKPKELSGGQRQRVAMGRAIVRKPAVFLFDEPLSNLDAKLRVQMRLELKSLQARLGVTSLYVTHDQVEAMTLADRVIIMNQGVAEQIGTPEDLYHNPRTTFVASFIGSPAMNLLNGELSASGDRFVFSDKTEVSMGFSKPAFARKSLILGIRPEHLQISETNSSGEEIAPDHIALQSKVTLVEHLGADNLVYTEFAGQTLLVRAAHHVKPAIGSLLNLTVPKANLYYFDAQTGKRVD